jgi:ariadne-1
MSFEPHEKDGSSLETQPFNVDFKVLSSKDIEVQQMKQIEEVSAIIGEPPESAAILLRHFRWNRERLIESYMDHPEATLDSAGLGLNSEKATKTERVPGFTCEICYEDDPDCETYAMRCGHRYCVDCYQRYLAQKIRSEGEAARIRCPKEGCNWIIDSRSLDLLVTLELRDRFV